MDQVSPIPFDVIERIVTRETGRPLSECFVKVEREPLAAASIVQVHTAQLSDGSQVVLKVQRPGVLTTLQADLFILTMLIRILQVIYPVLRRANILQIARDMSHKFREECNFLVEAERVGKFAEFLSQAQVKIVTVPRVHEQLTTSKLLVMERFRGEPISDAKSIKHALVDPALSLQMALQVWLMSVTQCEFIHADVHGGNLLILTDGRIGMIDFGVVDSIERDDWQAAVDCITALQQRSFRDVALAMVRLGATGDDVDQSQLTVDLADSLGRLGSAPCRGPNQPVGTAFADLCGIAQRHDLCFPNGFFLLLRQYFYFERYLQLAQP